MWMRAVHLGNVFIDRVSSHIFRDYYRNMAIIGHSIIGKKGAWGCLLFQIWFSFSALVGHTVCLSLRFFLSTLLAEPYIFILTACTSAYSGFHHNNPLAILSFTCDIFSCYLCLNTSWPSAVWYKSSAGCSHGPGRWTRRIQSCNKLIGPMVYYREEVPSHNTNRI